MERKPRQPDEHPIPDGEVEDGPVATVELQRRSGPPCGQRRKRDLAVLGVQEGPAGAVRVHGHALVGGGAGESLEAYAGILVLWLEAYAGILVLWLGGGGRRRGWPSAAPWGNRADAAGVDRLGRGRGYAPLHAQEDGSYELKEISNIHR